MEKRKPLGMQWLASAGCLVIYYGGTKCVEILIEENSEVIKVGRCHLVTSTLSAFLLRKGACVSRYQLLQTPKMDLCECAQCVFLS